MSMRHFFAQATKCEICGKTRTRGTNHSKCSRIKQIRGFNADQARHLKAHTPVTSAKRDVDYMVTHIRKIGGA